MANGIVIENTYMVFRGDIAKWHILLALICWGYHLFQISPSNGPRARERANPVMNVRSGILKFQLGRPQKGSGQRIADMLVSDERKSKASENVVRISKMLYNRNKLYNWRFSLKKSTDEQIIEMAQI